MLHHVNILEDVFVRMESFEGDVVVLLRAPMPRRVMRR
jgi:hypothetical protein